jgi:hypothetical protein
VKRLLIPFHVRLGVEFSKFFWLHNEIHNKLNEYDIKIQKAPKHKHFRWIVLK